MAAPELDVALALHCLSDLGGRACPITHERAEMMKPRGDCDGLSIRDTLFAFLVQSIQEEAAQKKKKKSHPERIARLLGQQEALAYTIALVDNPYRPDPDKVRATAREEAS